MNYPELIEDGISKLIEAFPTAHRGEIHVSPDVYTELFFWAQEYTDGKMKGELTDIVFKNIKFKIIKHPDKLNFYDVSVSMYES